MEQLYSIDKLIDKIEDEMWYERNKEIAEKWNIPEVKYTYMHPVSKKRSQIPIIIDLEYPMWSKILNFNTKEFFTNPIVYLEKQLEMSLYRYNSFKDDSGLSKTVAIWLGVNFEASIFGSKSIYPDSLDPAIDRSFIIFEDEESLKKIEAKEINFKSDGILDLAHRFYYRIKEILPSDWNVIFPDWVIGPFGIATILRGYERTMLDLIDNPKFFMKMLDVINKKTIEFSTKRAKFLDIKIEKINLHNDDVNYPNLSEKIYEELIFPKENELSLFYGGFQYWHSCGNIEKFVEHILNFKNLTILDCSGWNNLDVFINTFNKKGINNVGIEKRFNPVKDVMTADKEAMTNKIQELYSNLEKSKKININFKIDGIGEINDFRENIQSVTNFINISREFGFK